MRRWTGALVFVFFVLGVASPAAAADCPDGRSSDAAMWLSIVHPGLGEWHLKGWGDFNKNAPPKKFWLGFIPGYGWPGYLQYVSAVDAKNCKTNDIP